MKKFIVLASLLAAGLAQADSNYASLTYDQKDKQNSAQVNHVYGLNVGQKFSNGVGVEVRMEDEKVVPGAGATQKQESLLQAKVSYDISTGTMFTPYVAGAVGQKNKSTSDFSFWVGEVGLKAKINDTFNVRYGWRQRTAFDTGANSYDTREHTIALGVNLTKHDAVSVAYKQERGTSDYNTTGVYYTRSF
jgi:Outer membrane protein beta-barrel domain